MRYYRWTGALFLFAAIVAILLYFISKAEGFPQEAMLVFWPAQYIWEELQGEFNARIRAIVGNVAVFGILAGLEGALAGLILDSYGAAKRVNLDRRVKHLRRGKNPMDLALKRRVLEILTKYDPTALGNAKTSEDAYESETQIILAKLRKLGSAEGLNRFCRQEFPRQFGRSNIKAFKEYEPLAREIWQAYRRQQSDARQTPPSSQGL